MKNTVITIIAVLVLLNCASATEIIAGNQEIAILDVSPSSCSILDDQNDSLSNYTLDGLNFTINGNNVTINTHPALKPGNYTLVCDYSWTEETEEDTSSYGGGGCRTTWECTEWGDCVEGNQTRDCSKVKSYCYAPKKDKPLEFRECEVQADSEDEEEPIQLEGEEKPKLILFYILCGVIFLAILFMWYRIVKKERKKKEDKENKNE